MDNGLLIGVSAQLSLRRRMDVVANNLANMNTAGFKADVALNELKIERPSQAYDNPNDIRFTKVESLQRDMRTGSLQLTGGDLDLAMEEANAFFNVQVGDQTFYTRDGQFALDELARLVTHEGARVLDDGGAEIVMDPEGPSPTISESGTIRQGELIIAQLAVSSFETPEVLEKAGNNLWLPGDQVPTPTETPRIQQGFVEQSNVNAVLEVTRMIEISRAYTSASSLVKDTDELRQNAISKLGAVA